MGSRLETSASIVIMVSALSIAGSVVYRTLVTPTVSVEPSEPAPDYIEGWEEALEFGITLGGDPGAPVSIVELADLECPACRGFHQTVLQELLNERDDVHVVYVAHPLTYHRQAVAAALAAECADSVGRFAQWIDAVYVRQDSLGYRPWERYAEDAGIRRSQWVADCARGTSLTARIRRGLDFGARIAMRGTPTVLVNGWRLGGTPSRTELVAVIDAVLQGDAPAR